MSSLRVSFLCAIVFTSALCLGPLTAQDLSTNSAPISPDNARAANGLLRNSSDALDRGDLDEALRKVDAALQLDPQNSAIYELRGSIYIQQRLWDRAEDDYLSASKLDPTDIAFKYKLAEIKYLQRAFDAARPRFAALQQDPRLGDLATYKVFLCDLLAAHEDLASRELAQINAGPKKPSYYYCNATWALFHQNPKDANAFFASAKTLYDDHTNDLYMAGLKQLNRVSAPVVSFTTKAAVRYVSVRAFVEDGGLRVSTAKGWITLPFDQLPDDLSDFPLDLRVKISSRRQGASDDITGMDLVTFTTKSGKHYDQVKWSMDDNGLRVLTADGRIVIPFAQLPDDLSVFPTELREQLDAMKQTPPDVAADDSPITFSTKSGKHYDQVKWSVTNDGLRILTPDGWVTVPIDQLPRDLSVFPPGLRKQLMASQVKPADASMDAPLLTFTTQKGKSYDHVKGAITDDGLRVLTPDGWATIPFNQLPRDLTVFPPDIRNQIEAKQKLAEGPSFAPILTFTTTKGKSYDHVKGTLVDDGLRVVTSDGWVTIPVDQLPEDLSSFPADLSAQIIARRAAAAPAEKSSPPPSAVSK